MLGENLYRREHAQSRAIIAAGEEARLYYRLASKADRRLSNKISRTKRRHFFPIP